MIRFSILRRGGVLALAFLLAARSSGKEPEPEVQSRTGAQPVLAVAGPDAADLIARAGTDRDRLAKLARAWSFAGLEREASVAWTRILALAPDDDEAHRGLRHFRYADRWFDTWTALARFQRAEDELVLRERGLVRWGARWVRPEERDWLEGGCSMDAAGRWLPRATYERVARETLLASQGWTRHGLEWFAPGERAEIDRVRVKCGEEWLEGEAADECRGKLAQPWLLESDHYAIKTTLPRAHHDFVRAEADATFDDLVRLFGVAPGHAPSTVDLFGARLDRPALLVVRSIAQYNEFAAADPTRNVPPPEIEGFSSLHYAFFADAWFDFTAIPPIHRAAGVAFHEPENPVLAPYGRHAVRHAAAHSFVEAIDPSWRAVASMPAAGLDIDAYWAEKRVPRWMRYGAASYVERYFIDHDAADPHWARTWAIGNLRGKGELRPLSEVFRFRLSLDDIEGSARRIHEAGLVVAYILDAGDEDVRRALDVFREALRTHAPTAEAVRELERALLAHERELRAFAGL